MAWSRRVVRPAAGPRSGRSRNRRHHGRAAPRHSLAERTARPRGRPGAAHRSGAWAERATAGVRGIGVPAVSGSLEGMEETMRQVRSVERGVRNEKRLALVTVVALAML